MSTRRLQTGEFLGRTRTRYREGGIAVSEIVHHAPRALPLHAHESAYFSLLLAGDYEEERGRQRLRYRTGALGFHPARLEHRDWIGAAGGHFVALELAPCWLERLAEVATPAGEPLLLPSEATWIAQRLLRECASRLPARRLAIEASVLELLVLAARSAPRAEAGRPAWLARVDELLREAPFDGWTAVTLAGAVGIHPAHLARSYRRLRGRTLAQAALEARIHAASRLLARPGCVLAEVATVAGFADQSHFTRLFRRVTGTTPGRYRRTLRR